MTVGLQKPQAVMQEEGPATIICEPMQAPTNSPFEEIRKHPLTAQIHNLREADFRKALGKYIDMKLHIRRMEKMGRDRGGQYTLACLERDKWRGLMDKIEFGLEYQMPLV